MDVSGTVSRPLPNLIGSSSGMEIYSNSPTSVSFLSFDDGRRNHRLFFGDNQLLGSRSRTRRVAMFSDEGHMQYYSSSSSSSSERTTTRMGRIRCGSGKIDKAAKANDKSMFLKEEKKMMKKRSKLVEGLSRDLTMFSDLGCGFGLDNNHGLVDQVQGKMMISEATELILGQLQKLKAEEEELKRKRKEEKVKLKAAARLQKRLDCEMSSSRSSSSESSDSECREVVDISSLRSAAALAPPVVDGLQLVMQETKLQPPSTLTKEESSTELQSVIREAHASLTIPSTVNQKGPSIEEEGVVGSYLQHIEQPCFTNQTSTNTSCSVRMAGGGVSLVNKVEVCMGGKCKKSGAAALLDEFQTVLGAEASVVGCKCMGKCRDGPNVRILNYSGVGVQAECADDSVRVPSNPLCIGVGFEDVGSIVATFLGEKHKECGMAAAS